MHNGERDAGDRRAAARLKIFQPAEMERNATRDRVHLLNLSTTGALIYGEEAPAVGTKVKLFCGFPLGEARVAWAGGRCFGVAFAKPLPKAHIDALLGAQNDLLENASRRLGRVGS
jgi:hypothetical protein